MSETSQNLYSAILSKSILFLLGGVMLSEFDGPLNCGWLAILREVGELLGGLAGSEF